MLNYYFLIILIIFLLLLFFHEIIHDLWNSSKPKCRIVFCVLLTLLFKYNYNTFYWGQEYEDAYVYSFCTRQFSYNIYPSNFMIEAISVGSLEEPIITSTYGGHFITYPVFLSLFTIPFGWSPTIICIANTLVAFFILLILSIMTKKSEYWFLPPALYCCSPIINIFTTCFLAEIFSSFICLIFIYTYFRRESTYNTMLCLIAFFVAILCKRENLVLLIIPVITIICYMKVIIRRTSILSKIVKIFPFLLIVCIYFLFIQNVFDIESVESKDIGMPTFSPQHFIKQFPVYVKSIFTVKFFSIIAYMYIMWIIYKCIYKKSFTINKSLSISLSLFLIYLFVYSFHYRGYFYVKGSDVYPLETFRYINNFIYLIPIAFITFNCKYIKYVQLIFSFLLVFSLFQTYTIRNKISITEYQERFMEAYHVYNYIREKSDNSVLICDDILIYQNICPDNFKVCDIKLSALLNYKDQRINSFLLFPDLNYLKERYSIDIDLQYLKPVLELSNSKYLYQYNCPE